MSLPAEPLQVMQRAIALVTELLGDDGADVLVVAELAGGCEEGAQELAIGVANLMSVLVFDVARVRGMEHAEVLQRFGTWVAAGADGPIFSE